MSEKTKRVSIGFHASAPIGVRVTEDGLKALQEALGSDGWHEVDAEDALIRVDMSKVIFVRVEKDEQRVGFGLGA